MQNYNIADSVSDEALLPRRGRSLESQGDPIWQVKAPSGNVTERGTVRWCRDQGGLSDDTLSAWHLAIAQYEQALPGCFNFTEVPPGPGEMCENHTKHDTVKLTEEGELCKTSRVGMPYDGDRLNEQMTVNLGPKCRDPGTAIHEIGHILGMIHTHCRQDRDDFISINMKNVDGRYHSSFEKCFSGYADGQYDYASIMHYNSSFAARNKSLPTMWAKESTCINAKNTTAECQRKTEEMGQRDGLSFLDILQLAHRYNCTVQRAWMTNTTCADWTHWEGKELNCTQYVADGKCTTNKISSYLPCCKCTNYGKRQQGGERVRMYGDPTSTGVAMMVDPACSDVMPNRTNSNGQTFCERMCGWCASPGFEKFATDACPYTCKRCKRLPILMDKCQDTNTTAGFAEEDEVNRNMYRDGLDCEETKQSGHCGAPLMKRRCTLTCKACETDYWPRYKKLRKDEAYEKYKCASTL